MINTGSDIAQIERFNDGDAGMGKGVMVLQRFRIDLIYGRKIQSQQFDAIFLQPCWNIGGDHRNLIWKHGGVTPSAGLYKEPRRGRYCFGGRPEVLDGNQMLFLRV